MVRGSYFLGTLNSGHCRQDTQRKGGRREEALKIPWHANRRFPSPILIDRKGDNSSNKNATVQKNNRNFNQKTHMENFGPSMLV